MTDDAAFLWDRPTPARTNANATPPAGAPEHDAGPAPDVRRITLRDASARYGVGIRTLRGWAREGVIDAIKDDRGRWMADAPSVAAAAASRAETPPVERASGPAPERTGPTDDGSAMLVPRDAWDRLIDQLGNLHEAGLMLAEARERAVKAETEVAFLRERLGELRAERDALRTEGAPTPPRDIPGDAPADDVADGVVERARAWIDRLRG
ncbi:MAG: hypothetical protein R3290_13025 [Acidimicrobiia bacterium]|nr:hypothetical protein [Acidimicrobiia bacterium]